MPSAPCRLSRRLPRWLPFLCWLAFVAAVIACADQGAKRDFFGWVNRQPYGDKAGHFLLVGTLAALLNYALLWQTTRIGRVQIQLGGMIIAVLMTLEETSQLGIATRSFDAVDLLANYAGILGAEWLARRCSRWGT